LLKKKTKPKVKWTKMNVTKVLTNCYEKQQKPGKKNKANLLFKFLIFELKIDDTKL